MSTGEQERLHDLVSAFIPGGWLLRAWPLDGGISAQMTAFEVEGPEGENRTYILRRLGMMEGVEMALDVETEYRLLSKLAETTIPAPRPCYFDTSGRYFDGALMVLDYIEGAPVHEPEDLEDHLIQQADQLAHIHKTAPVDQFRFLPTINDVWGKTLRERPDEPRDDLLETRVRDVLNEVWPLASPNKDVLLHGDFWLGNLLWRNDRLIAIVDWEDAAIGDPLADLAVTRQELLWTISREAMERFTQLYLDRNPIDTKNLPYWDLGTVVRWGFRNIDTWTDDVLLRDEVRKRQLWFFEQALKAIE